MITAICTHCGASYRVDETKIPPTGGAITCQKCKQRFIVRPDAIETEQTVIGPPPTAPMPAPAAFPSPVAAPVSPFSMPAMPAPAAVSPFAMPAPLPSPFAMPTSAPVPAPKSASNAIPLPGAAGPAAVKAPSPPPAVASSGAIPLPGAAPSQALVSPFAMPAVKSNVNLEAPASLNLLSPAPLPFAPPPLAPPELLDIEDEPMSISEDDELLDPPQEKTTVTAPSFAPSFNEEITRVGPPPQNEEAERITMPPPVSLAEPEDLPAPAPAPPMTEPLFAPLSGDTLREEGMAPPPLVAGHPADLPTPVAGHHGDLPTPLEDELPPSLEDDLPPPLEADEGEQPLEPIDLAQLRQERRLQAPPLPEALLRDDDETRVAATQKRSRVPLFAGLAVVAVGASLVAFQLTTGQWPWEAHTTQAPAPTAPIAKAAVPPAPDFAPLDGGDMDTLETALATLDERAKGFAQENQPVPPTDAALRAKILWHGAVFNGSHAFAAQLAQQASSQPAAAEPSPDDERARAAAALLAHDGKNFKTLTDRLLARDKGDVEALLLQGVAKLRVGDADGAAPAFDAVLVVRPKSIDALLGLARVAEASDDQDGAANWIKQAKAVDADNARVGLEAALASNDEKQLLAIDDDRDTLGEGEGARLDFALALIAAKAAHVGEAVARVAAAYHAAPTPDRARRFAWLALYQGNLDVAAKAFDDAFKLDENGAYAETIFLGRAQLAIRRNQPEAVHALEAAGAKAGIDKRSLWLAEGWALEQEKKLPQAGKAFAASLKADKTFTYAMLGLERVATLKLKPKVRAARLAAIAKKFADARVTTALASALLDDGDAAGAAEKFESALHSDPWAIDLPAVVNKYVDALNRAGRKDDAARIVSLGQKVDPKDPVAAVKAVHAALASGDVPGAQSLATKALEAAPGNVSLLLAQADVMIRANQREQARETVQKVLKTNETLPEAHATMARSYFPADPDTAKIHIRRAIELAPQNASYQFLLGQTYEAKEKWEEAKDAFSRVVELEPQNADAHVALGHCFFELDRKRDGVRELASALQLAPERSELYAQVGAQYDDTGDRPKAIQIMQSGLKRNPSSYELLTQLGKIYQELGNRAAALKLYTQALKVRPNEPAVHYQLGYLYKDSSQSANARREFEAYLRLNPKADDAKDIEAEIADLK